MSKKQVFCTKWVYMINCNENANDNEPDRMNKTSIDQDVEIVANIQNIHVSLRECLYVTSNA